MYLKTWEDFEKASEKLYLSNPTKARLLMKYKHKEGALVLKFTDDVVCLQYKTENQQDLKKLDKFTAKLMRHMTSDEK